MIFKQYTPLTKIDIEIQMSVYGSIHQDDLYNDLDELLDDYGEDAEYSVLLMEYFPEIMLN
jgi:hypothetical protein